MNREALDHSGSVNEHQIVLKDAQERHDETVKAANDYLKSKGWMWHRWRDLFTGQETSRGWTLSDPDYLVKEPNDNLHFVLEMEHDRQTQQEEAQSKGKA